VIILSLLLPLYVVNEDSHIATMKSSGHDTSLI